jgi:uncharacterized protein (DUF1015 family)
MAEIRPFRAVRCNAEKVGELGRVVTQPYDKINPEMQARYYDLSPYNLVRIIRGRQNPADSPEDNVYTRAARHFGDWVEEGALVPDSAPAIYPYDQEYAVPGERGVVRRRRGFIALGRLEDYSARVVHRHEETLSGPKADRLELLKATRAHFGQIFVLYSDPGGEIERAMEAAVTGQAAQRVTDEYGCHHSLWRLSNSAAIERVTAAMREKPLVIADGHHRYETALAFRDYCRAQARTDARADFVMMTFVRKESEGLTILPTHRVVHDLPFFDWSGFVASAERFFNCETITAGGTTAERGPGTIERLRESGREAPSFATYAGGGRLALLRLRKNADLAAVLPGLPDGLRRLDVVILHRLLIEQVLGIDRQAVREEKNLHYVREWAEALEQVDSGRAEICFLLNPTSIDQVWDNALAGQPLPQKSTDFYPKLLSGLAAYWLDGPAAL